MSNGVHRRPAGAAATVLVVLLVLLTLSIDTRIGLASPVCEPQVPSTCSLRQLADMTHIRLGSTAEAAETTDVNHADLLAREFNALTPENALKWYATQPTAWTWDFTDADTVVQFALDNGMQIRGHTLLWAQDTYTPAWVLGISDPTALQIEVDAQITATMDHFAGRVHRWDVVNEPLATLGTGPSDSVLWRLGPQWIADAFRLAHSVDPDAELWLNEYGTDWVPGKHEALLDLVRGLVDDGVPIHGVGLQTHRLPGFAIDPDRFIAQLRDVTSLGLQVAITELDIPISPTDPSALDQQATEYASIVTSCLRVPGCVEITTWGLSDGSTWLDSLGRFPTPTRPLLFDAAFAPKPAYRAVRDVLATAVISESSPTDSLQPTAEEPTLPVT